MTDDKLAGFIRKDGFNNRAQLFSLSSAGYVFDNYKFTIMETVLSDFIKDPNNCL